MSHWWSFFLIVCQADRKRGEILYMSKRKRNTNNRKMEIWWPLGRVRLILSSLCQAIGICSQNHIENAAFSLYTHTTVQSYAHTLIWVVSQCNVQVKFLSILQIIIMLNNINDHYRTWKVFHLFYIFLCHRCTCITKNIYFLLWFWLEVWPGHVHRVFSLEWEVICVRELKETPGLEGRWYMGPIQPCQETE